VTDITTMIEAEAARNMKARTNAGADSSEWIKQMEAKRSELVRIVAGNSKMRPEPRLCFLRAINDGYIDMLNDLAARGQL
jgi:hypothetical protein